MSTSSPLPLIPATNARSTYARRSSKEELLSSGTSTPSPALPPLPGNASTERKPQQYREMRDLTANHGNSTSNGAPRLASSSPEHLHISHSATQLANLANPSPSKAASVETHSDQLKPLESNSQPPSAPRSTTPNSASTPQLDSEQQRSIELERERERAVGLGLGRIEESPSATSLPPPQSEIRSTPSRQGDREEEDIVPVGFDEGILKGLCELDVSSPYHSLYDAGTDHYDLQCGMPLLADRMKQTMA